MDPALRFLGCKHVHSRRAALFAVLLAYTLFLASPRKRHISHSFGGEGVKTNSAFGPKPVLAYDLESAASVIFRILFGRTDSSSGAVFARGISMHQRAVAAAAAAAAEHPDTRDIGAGRNVCMCVW